ncbi:hypothetical protein FOXYS1_3082 [Fusarium oxysporum]|nr:hypothetical protein FOXYS1_3082 [Fusarium oxysporum]
MENLNYRIMPLCDEDCLTDAMVDMQYAAQQPQWDINEHIPADSDDESDDSNNHNNYVPSHSRSKTLGTGSAVLGLGLSLTPVDTPTAEASHSTTPQPSRLCNDYFNHFQARED